MKGPLRRGRLAAVRRRSRAPPARLLAAAAACPEWCCWPLGVVVLGRVPLVGIAGGRSVAAGESPPTEPGVRFSQRRPVRQLCGHCGHEPSHELLPHHRPGPSAAGGGPRAGRRQPGPGHLLAGRRTLGRSLRRPLRRVLRDGLCVCGPVRAHLPGAGHLLLVHHRGPLRAGTRVRLLLHPHHLHDHGERRQGVRGRRLGHRLRGASGRDEPQLWRGHDADRLFIGSIKPEPAELPAGARAAAYHHTGWASPSSPYCAPSVSWPHWSGLARGSASRPDGTAGKARPTSGAACGQKPCKLLRLLSQDGPRVAPHRVGVRSYEYAAAVIRWALAVAAAGLAFPAHFRILARVGCVHARLLRRLSAHSQGAHGRGGVLPLPGGSSRRAALLPVPATGAPSGRGGGRDADGPAVHRPGSTAFVGDAGRAGRLPPASRRRWRPAGGWVPALVGALRAMQCCSWGFRPNRWCSAMGRPPRARPRRAALLVVLVWFSAGEQHRGAGSRVDQGDGAQTWRRSLPTMLCCPGWGSVPRWRCT